MLRESDDAGRSVRMEMTKNVRRFEAMGKHQSFIGQQFARAAVGDHLAMIKNDRPAAKFHGKLEVVGGDELGGRNSTKQCLEFAAATRVEIARRFVEDEQLRFASKHSGETGAAFFAVAQMMCGALVKTGQADLGQRALDPIGNGRFVHAKLSWAEAHVLSDRRAKKLVIRVLKNDADAAADSSQIFGRDGLAQNFHSPIGGRLFRENAVQMKQQGGFAGAVGAQQGHALAGRDGEADSAQGFGPVVVAVRQLGDFDGVHFQPRAHMASKILSARSEARTKRTPSTEERVCHSKRRPDVKVRQERARRMRSLSSASTKR